ncbi:UDP-N-acetylmuramate dehydrogenase [Rhodococcus coprophilus]|uniref:UDP-N-acetylmuramate dehydrogenase n=1 Tax=Rhodococcus coprophilus TaxID=38310 RepID=UPI000932D5D0|nr:UDP-N-acetylmuramate dehydrogenase [Rhodococcus coprophilus]MBM7459747.1 UDP-N-acetylmuramate dehydrogenase [Rhodococcus coprophilus]
MLDPRIRARLADAGAVISEQVPLSSLTTLRLGGPAEYLAECTSTDALVQVIRLLDQHEVPLLLIAGGSNLVIGDDGFKGVVVRIATGGISVSDSVVRADAGAEWDAVVAAAVAAGVGGLECLSGIPGSAGATPVQNVGAYGVEVGSLLRRVHLLDRLTGETRWVEPGALGLGYRTSVLKHSDHAVVLEIELDVRADGLSAPLGYRELSAALGAEQGERRPTAQVRDHVLALRRGKGMVLDPADPDTWSAGSFFTNPVVPEDRLPGVLEAIDSRVGPGVRIPQYPADGGTKLSAAWLIERAGFAKGFPGPDAPASLSTKHTLALTNRGSATTADLVALARQIRDRVEEVFGVRLHPEPVTVGCAI